MLHVFSWLASVCASIELLTQMAVVMNHCNNIDTRGTHIGKPHKIVCIGHTYLGRHISYAGLKLCHRSMLVTLLTLE